MQSRSCCRCGEDVCSGAGGCVCFCLLSGVSFSREKEEREREMIEKK